MICLRLWVVLLLSANAVGFLLPEPPEFMMLPAPLTPEEPGLTLKEQFDVMVENFDRMSDGAKRLAALKFQVEELRQKAVKLTTRKFWKIDPRASDSNKKDIFGEIGKYDEETGDKMTLSDPDKYFQLDQLNAELKRKGEPPINKADAESYWEYTVDYFKDPKLKTIARQHIAEFLGEDMNEALEAMSPVAKTFLADADNAGLLDKMIGAAGSGDAADVYAKAAALRMKNLPREWKAAKDQVANVRKLFKGSKFLDARDKELSEQYFIKNGMNPVVILEDFRKYLPTGKNTPDGSDIFFRIRKGITGNPFGADKENSALEDLLLDLKKKTNVLVRTADVGGVSGDDVKLLVDAWKAKKRLGGMAQVVFNPADGTMTPTFDADIIESDGKTYRDKNPGLEDAVKSLSEKSELEIGASAVTDAAGNLVVKTDTAARWIEFKGEFERLESYGIGFSAENKALMFGEPPNLPENPALLKKLGLPQDAEAQYINRILELQKEYRLYGNQIKESAVILNKFDGAAALREKGIAGDYAKDVDAIQKLFDASRNCKDSGFFALSEGDFESLAKLPATQPTVPAGTTAYEQFETKLVDATKSATGSLEELEAALLEPALKWSRNRLGIRGELKKALDEFNGLPDTAKDAGKFLRNLQALEGKGIQSLVLSVTGLGPPSKDELEKLQSMEKWQAGSLTREDLAENGLDTKFDAWREETKASQRLETEVDQEIRAFFGDLKEATARSSKQIKKAVGRLSKTKRQILKEIALSDDMSEAFGVDEGAAKAIVARTKANFFGFGKLKDEAVTERMKHCETWVKARLENEGKTVRASAVWNIKEEFDIKFLEASGVGESEARSTIERTASIVSPKPVLKRCLAYSEGSVNSNLDVNRRRLLQSDCGGGLEDKTTEDKFLDSIKDQTDSYRKGDLLGEWNAAKDEAMKKIQEAARYFDEYEAFSGETRKFNFDTYKSNLMKNPEAFSEAQLELFRKTPILINAAPTIEEGDPALNLETGVWNDVVKAEMSYLEKIDYKSSVNLVDQNFLTRLNNENLAVDYENQQADIEGYTTISQRLEEAPSKLVQGPPKLPPTQAELRAEVSKWMRTAGTPEEAALSPELTKLFDASKLSSKEEFMKEYFFSAMQADVEAQFEEFSADWEANNPGSEGPTFAEWNSFVKSDATPDALPDATPPDVTPEEMDAMIETTMKETSDKAGGDLYSSELGKSMRSALEDYLSQDTAMAVKYAGEAAFGEAMERQIAEAMENVAKDLI